MTATKPDTLDLDELERLYWLGHASGEHDNVIDRLLDGDAPQLLTLIASAREAERLRERVAELEATCPPWYANPEAKRAVDLARQQRDDAEQRCRDLRERVAELERSRDAAVERAEAAEDVLRDAACYVAAGGYNAPTVDAALFQRKIRDGVDMSVDAARGLGRREERAAVVAWMLRDADSCETTALIKPGSAHTAAILRIAAKTIEDGEHIDGDQ
jgi:hypothetical protein